MRSPAPTSKARSNSSKWSGDKLEAGSVGDPGVLWWQGDLAEAYIALDRHSAAARLHQYLAAQARATGRGWGLGVEARVRGLIEQDDRAARGVSGFRSSSSTTSAHPSRLHVHACSPRRSSANDPARAVPRAQTRGRDLRHTRCRPLVSTPRSAGPTQCVGATPTSVAGKLTRAEVHVAVEVASGRTNREIAEHLFVSRGPSMPTCARSFASSMCSRAPSSQS